jgi:hypothetical protein
MKRRRRIYEAGSNKAPKAPNNYCEAILTLIESIAGASTILNGYLDTNVKEYKFSLTSRRRQYMKRIVKFAEEMCFHRPRRQHEFRGM